LDIIVFQPTNIPMPAEYSSTLEMPLINNC
jgi:hypothetical protein